jgi:hypothetical protein
LFYEYAEQYPTIQPQDVPKIVTVRAWERWLVLRAARAGRLAWQASQQVEDWTRDLTPDTRAAMRWAMNQDDEEA